MPDSESDGVSEVITARSRSNLAFALACLSKEKRSDMIVLYAFCREVDNLADDLDLPESEKNEGLLRWRALVRGEKEAAGAFEREVSALIAKYPKIRLQLLQVIRGMRQDLRPVDYQTWPQLRKYCYMVASAVGLASLEIFGYKHRSTRIYAVYLGYALQVTNIMRDLGEDLENGRIYLPNEDLLAAGYSREELWEREYNESFLQLMENERNRVISLHRTALSHLHEEDRPNVISAELMGRIYEEILEKMRADNWRVFDRRYKLSKARMVVILLGHLLRVKLDLS